MPAVLNAANEIAVAAFLEKRVGFREIHRIIAKTMAAHAPVHPEDVREILEVDRWARERASRLVDRKPASRYGEVHGRSCSTRSMQ
jgi:1-deoxy-D-xylulose-5-phosphate reductoisomerase